MKGPPRQIPMGGLSIWRGAGRRGTAILGRIDAPPARFGAGHFLFGILTVPFSAGALLAFTAAAFFSLKAIFVKLAYIYGVDAVTLLALRMIMCLPVLLIAVDVVNPLAAPKSLVNGT